MITVVVPNYNGAELLNDCMQSLMDSSFIDFHFILVDNNSTDNSRAIFDSFNFSKDWIGLKENYGFAKAVNEGIKKSTSKYIFLLNNDTLVPSETLKLLFNKIEVSDEDYGAIQPLMLRMDNTSLIDDAGDTLSWYGIALKGMHLKEYSEDIEEMDIFSPSGGATLYKKSFFEKVGYFDEAFNSYLEDVDIGLRGQLYGFKFLLFPSATILHKGGGSNIKRGKYFRLITKNRLSLFVKNIPAGLFFKNFGKICYGQIFHFLSYSSPLQSTLGYLDFIKIFPQLIVKRKAIIKSVNISNKEIAVLLNSESPNSNILILIKHFVRNIFNGLINKLK